MQQINTLICDNNRNILQAQSLMIIVQLTLLKFFELSNTLFIDFTLKLEYRHYDYEILL
jgi:hypothetical protein